MKKFLTSIVFLIFSLIVTANDKLSRNNENDESGFCSFLTNFDQFTKQSIDASIFYGRKLRESDYGMPKIDTNKFNEFIPFDNTLDCKKKHIVYRPGYKKETEDIIVIGIVGFCKNSISEANILVTYKKNGKIIDYEYIGLDGKNKYYELKKSVNNQSLIYTQYSFKNTKQLYSGKCNVSIYRITINTDGTIDKEVIKEYEDNLSIEF